MTEREDLLARIFTDAEDIILELSAENGRFNSQQFVRRVMQEQQQAYIEFLYYHRNDNAPFQQAHQEIGQELKRRAVKLGFSPVGLVDEESVFRTRTTATQYTRS